MRETAKCRNFRRERGDFENFLRGWGIDIGAGNDCLRVDEGVVRAWDVGDGDAQVIAGIVDNAFDFVYSSHCLEDMRDVREALRNWIRILKPGGYLYLVVPDYVLYEKMTWPSMFNSEHKQSFSILIPREATGRTNHFHVELDLKPLLGELGMDVVRTTLEDYLFNYNAGSIDQTKHRAVAQLCVVGKKRA